MRELGVGGRVFQHEFVEFEFVVANLLQRPFWGMI